LSAFRYFPPHLAAGRFQRLAANRHSRPHFEMRPAITADGIEMMTYYPRDLESLILPV
jgi:hypothetical protein